MKVALTSKGENLDSMLDPRFGRASGFVIFDTDKNDFTFLDNKQNLNAPQGAGIQAAQNVVNSGAEILITGHCGPKAFAVLKQADVKIYCINDMKLSDALDEFLKGSFTPSVTSDVQGHW